MDVTTTVGNVTVLTIKGDIDSNTFQQVIEKGNTVLNQGYKNLVLDLSGVNYVSSSGLVAFQSIAGRAVGMGGKVAFSGATPKVTQVFEMTGFNKILGVFPDVAAAKASFDQT